jgi:DNA-binding XRE family transcriptional regulator
VLRPFAPWLSQPLKGRTDKEEDNEELVLRALAGEARRGANRGARWTSGGMAPRPSRFQATSRYSPQTRAARALLGWSQGKLARVAGIGLTTLQRIEQREGVVKGNFSTALKIQKALEAAGILFTDDEAGEIGVRLKTDKQ